MELARLKAERRSALGRNQIKKLRSEGWMPAVVYGGEGKEPLSIQISEWELEQHVNSHHKVYELDIDGSAQSAWLQDVAWKATTDRPLHADFLRIDLDQPMEADLEITLMGHPAGLSRGGALIKDNLIIRVKAKPLDLPAGHEVDISPMDTGTALRAKDLKLPDGVEIAVNPELPICRVTGGAAVPAGDEAGDAGEAGDS
ncbi:MAG TPA: 50S ribosomal protein L25 [bacterium]|nr:50S ribosomal protein L25 [bacterium]